MKKRCVRLLGCLLFAALVLACSACCAQTGRGDLAARFADVPSITREGVTYTLNPRMISLLFIGVDSERAHAEQTTFYRDGGQADFLLLLAVNDNAKTVAPIQINRDTLADVAVYSVFGQPIGTARTQIALAHAYGDGREKSCELTAQAVSGLLLDTPVDETLSLSMDGIAALNDLLGGVTVTLEDDFSAYDPAMTPGRTLRLAGRQAEIYVRQRYYVGDQTNLSRQRRQNAFIEAATAILGERLRADSNYAMTLYDGLEPYLVTSMSRGKLINMGNRAAHYTVLPVAHITGEAVLNQDGFMELHPDEDALLDLVLSTFYTPLP